jgi:monothiol glutaredoxin
MSDILHNKIKELVTDNAIVLFMKGTSEMPQCGFSATVVHILNTLGVSFIGIDILEDEELRQAIKEYSDWPTIPQLYINAEFVGGCDIVKEIYANGELRQLLNL